MVVLPLVLIGVVLVAQIVVFETLRERRRVRRYVERENGRRFFVYEERDKSRQWIRDHLLPLAEAEIDEHWAARVREKPPTEEYTPP